MSLNHSETLARFGFNPAEAHLLNQYSADQRKIYLKQELETHVNHTLEDLIVSLPYYYQRGLRGEILSYPSQIPVFIDEEERGGLFNQGVNQAVNLTVENPQKLVFLYSPPGPIVFDDNPNNKYLEFKPYDRGQLNIMYFDGEKICNVSVMISTKEGEEWLRKVLGDVYLHAQQLSGISGISYFITHPKLADYDIDKFLNFPWSNLDKVIFINRSGRHFTLSETLDLIKASFSGKLKPAINTFDKTIAALDKHEITENFIRSLYLGTMQSYMEQKNLMTLTLGGGCGGTTVNRSPFGTSISEIINNLSSSYRLLTQSELNNRYPDYDCPNCGARLKGELKNNEGSWKRECPQCRTPLHCS